MLWPHQQHPPATLVAECERRGIELRAGVFKEEGELEDEDSGGGGLARS